MLELMFDGKEFRLSDGRSVDLRDADIYHVSIRMNSYFSVFIEAQCDGPVKNFNTEFELELWRNSCKSSGLYRLHNNGVGLVIAGEKVLVSVTKFNASVEYIDVSMMGGKILEVPMYSATEIEFVVPIYKEKQ